MLNEIFNAYTHPPVVEAAVRSLGPAFAQQVKVAGRARGLSIGGYASRAVQLFGKGASPATRQAMQDAMRSADQPILAGIAFVLELAMDDDEEVVVAPHRRVAPAPEALADCVC